jgi:hypothetical protein
MFSDEVAVKFKSSRGDSRSFFVPKGVVSGEPGDDGSDARIRVSVYHADHHWWAVVPNEMQTAVPVREQDLEAATSWATP